MQFAMKRGAVMLSKPARKAACLPNDNIESEQIEKMRKTLRHTYYHIPREINMQEVDMILKPLFSDVSLDVTMIGNRVYIVISNTPRPQRDFDTNFAVLDLVNEWGMHDKMRRFLIRGLTSANKHDLYKYAPGVCWKCPMDVTYVFADADADSGNNEEGGFGDICI